VVTATGMHTEMGKIAGLLRQTKSEPTPIQPELDRTDKLLGIVVVIIALVIVVTIILVEGIREFGAIVDVLILGVALAVAAVPEGLPAIMTAVLALGMQRMATRNAIVRKLPAVETLGSAKVTHGGGDRGGVRHCQYGDRDHRRGVGAHVGRGAACHRARGIGVCPRQSRTQAAHRWYCCRCSTYSTPAPTPAAPFMRCSATSGCGVR
jgi:hypothetical protein